MADSTSEELLQPGFGHAGSKIVLAQSSRSRNAHAIANKAKTSSCPFSLLLGIHQEPGSRPSRYWYGMQLSLDE